MGELTKELMRRLQVAHAHSTTYHLQTNGFVERQSRTLVSMLREYCSSYMTDWDKYLPQVMRAYNSMQHSTTGVSPRMMLTGHEKSLPLLFFTRSILPQKEVVRTDLQPFEQETQPLGKIWCAKMEDDTHQPDEMNSQMRVMKTYLRTRYRLSDLLRAQRNDRMTSNLKRWIENGAPDKGLENKILSGEFRWMRKTHRTDPEEGSCSIADSSIGDNSRNSGIDTYSDMNSSSGSGNNSSIETFHKLVAAKRGSQD